MRVTTYHPRIVDKLDRKNNIVPEDTIGMWNVEIEFSTDGNRTRILRLTVEVDLSCYDAILRDIKIEVDWVKSAGKGAAARQKC